MSALPTVRPLRAALRRLARVDFVRALAYEPRRELAASGIGDDALVAAASLWREAQGDMHAELGCDAPRWPRLRALHSVERAASVHLDAVQVARRTA